MHLIEKIEIDNGIKMTNKLTLFIDPDYVFIPINKDILVKYKEYVYKENIVTIDKCSPISGNVVGTKECLINNKKEKCLVIENDFKELLNKKVYSKKLINKLTEIEVNNILKEFNKELKFTKDILVINGLNEMYINNNSFILNEFINEITEIIDALVDIYKFKKVILCINEIDGFNIVNYSNIKGLIPEIKLEIIPNLYLLNKNNYLLDYLKLAEDTTIISSQYLYNLYVMIKRNHNICESFISITGNAIENASFLKVKIGTNLKEIIDKYIKIIDKNYVIVVNSLLNGYETNMDLIITEDINGIIINKKQEYKEQTCINCGKCFQICPKKIDPKYLIEKKIIDDKCIDCGLCTYICPCYINLRKYLKGDTNE